MMRALIIVLILVISMPVLAETVTITASQDNTVYSGGSSSRSNGAGAHLFVGRIQQNDVRRALVAFKDLSAIPNDATIESVKLLLQLNKKNPNSAGSTISAHRVTTDWGEGTSDAPMAEGQGTAATAGDATWMHNMFNTSTWNSQGGDFAGAASGQVMVDNVAAYTIGSTAAMVSDVQGWLDNPGSNFGWIIIGDENNWSARRFGSREGVIDFTRPMLEIEYSGGMGGGGFMMNAGLNGNWWNGPDRSGEGAQVEVADNGSGGMVFVATVYSYDTMGNQIFLIAVGQVVGDTAMVDVFITDGGMWGADFDPADITETQWGTGTFTASSCGLISMSLMPNAQYQALGYTNLMYDLVRLTTPVIDCPFPASN